MYVLCAQKNSFIKVVLLSTHNICFGQEIRKKNCRYALLTKGLDFLRHVYRISIESAMLYFRGPQVDTLNL